MIFNFSFGSGFAKMHLRCPKIYSLNIETFFPTSHGISKYLWNEVSYGHICHACMCQSISKVSTIFYKFYKKNLQKNRVVTELFSFPNYNTLMIWRLKQSFLVFILKLHVGVTIKILGFGFLTLSAMLQWHVSASQGSNKKKKKKNSGSGDPAWMKCPFAQGPSTVCTAHWE
jgi:hypothetical protein